MRVAGSPKVARSEQHSPFPKDVILGRISHTVFFTGALSSFSSSKSHPLPPFFLVISVTTKLTLLVEYSNHLEAEVAPWMSCDTLF